MKLNFKPQRELRGNQTLMKKYFVGMLCESGRSRDARYFFFFFFFPVDLTADTFESSRYSIEAIFLLFNLVDSFRLLT